MSEPTENMMSSETPTPGLKDKKSRLALIIAGTGIILFLLISVTFPFRDKLFSQLFPKPASKALANISRPTTVKIDRVVGFVTAVSGNNLTLDVEGTPMNFSLANTQDIQQVTSGSLQNDNVVTTPTSARGLAVGQQILVISPRDSTSSAKPARSVYILQ